MMSSTTRARVSNDSNHAMDPAVAPRLGASSISVAAAVDAPDARNSAPSHGLSAQIGRFDTVSSTPVYPATKKPSRPPSPAMILANGVPDQAPISARNAHRANSRIAHAPNEIGE